MKAKIITKKWSLEPNYYPWDDQRNYPFFDEIERFEYLIDAKSLDEACLWVYVTHPEQAIGFNISLENGDFLLGAIASLEYGNDILTEEGRKRIVERDTNITRRKLCRRNRDDIVRRTQKLISKKLDSNYECRIEVKDSSEDYFIKSYDRGNSFHLYKGCDLIIGDIPESLISQFLVDDYLKGVRDYEE